ncbi:ATPase H(+)-transporting accessory protein 2 [Tribolium castaneum]|uniref:Renin receptor-like Protein n=1 Tax=Tribolium castaneum TaxID=7070 RepID=D6WJV7_TRICA|nr:PREDICTED: renin receptor [Tribolium castaneum]EFA03659.1 Renin receptor-like Protein [Tribolium castaneum]|eukprot:XP_973593.1 PREDICTED: renin receptor [Tribolium castaneum]
MIVPLICVAFLGASVSANGELTILHHPPSLLFKGHDHVKESILKEVYSSALGFSTEQYSNWDGLYIEDPFNLAKAVVTVSVDGTSDIGNGKGHNFPLKTNVDEFDVFSALERRVLQRYPETEGHLVRISAGDSLHQLHKHKVFRNLKLDKSKKVLNYLKASVEEDQAFLNEITVLNSIADEIQNSGLHLDGTPDVFWFKIESLHPLIDLYGENSTKVKEAKQLLNDAILHLNSVFTKVYKDKVLVSVITSDAVHTRRARNILQEKKPEPKDTQETKVNPAKFYSKDYPVIFNIILWFGVAMTFTLLAICIAIAQMDPGRDSIIYRMTSTRLKKDN